MTSIVSGMYFVLNFGALFGLLALLYSGFEILSTKASEYSILSLIGLTTSLFLALVLFWMTLKNIWSKVNKA